MVANDNNFTGIDYEKHVVSYLRNAIIHPVRAIVLIPGLSVAFCVPRRFSVMFSVCFVLLRFVYCAHYWLCLWIVH